MEIKEKEKKLESLVPDIYELVHKLNNNGDISENILPHLDEFINDVKEAVVHWSKVDEHGDNRDDGLRMSNIGRPDRRLWFDINKPIVKDDESGEGSQEDPFLQIKFLYGHILEQVALLLVRAAGHKVESTQKEVEVDGIKGHMDSVIDGQVIDIKTSSGFAFKKFKEGRLGEDDPWGYLTQLAGYEKAEDTEEGGFFVINKETGELCLYIPEDLDKPNIEKRIEYVKTLKDIDIPEELCYPDQPHGKAGNMTINRMCTYCPYKEECRKDANDGYGLRKFKYSDGIKYFTEIVKEPNVDEAK